MLLGPDRKLSRKSLIWPPARSKNDDPKNPDCRYYFMAIRGDPLRHEVIMQTAILSTALLASSIACAGCGGGDGGAGGGGGAGATGGSGGPATALSFDADTALPAMGGASAAIAFATRFGKTLSSILEGIAVAPQEPPRPLSS